MVTRLIDKGTRFVAVAGLGLLAPSDTGQLNDPGPSAARTAIAYVRDRDEMYVFQGGSYTLLTNNMPYAYRIEFEGYSKTKAPEGMVRKNVARFRQLLQEEAQKNRV